MSEKVFTHGRFVWRELMTSDVESAKGFYGELLGWSFKGMEIPHGDTYWIAESSGAGVGGLMKKPADVPAPPFWSAYVSVDDVDAAVNRAKAAGGASPMPVMNLENVGRMGMIISPEGAVSWAFKAADGDMPRTDRPKPGEFCWESLSARDIPKAVEFYTKVYGWKATTFNGMTVLGTGEGMENQVADVSTAPPGAPAFWVSNVVVLDVAASRARVEKLGGKVMVPEIVVPTIGTIALVQDREGAVLALFQPQM